MIREIDIKDLLLKENIIFIDVRSPNEFEEDSLPNAINIPILTDEEREYVGYLYKQVNPDKAKEIGLEYASNKLVNFYRSIKEIKESNKDIALYCYRGGMRSNSVANVLSIMGLDIYILTGGYKSYRKYVLEMLDKFSYIHYNFYVLHGYTGVGKTKILKILEENKQQIIDLELLARNSGSVFGSIGFNNQSNSQKKFESLLVNVLNKLDHNNITFLESESKRIGKVVLPDFISHNMDKGHHILIETDINNRMKNIMDEYIYVDTKERDENIINAIYKLKSKLGNNKVDEYANYISDKEYGPVIKALMVDYYDPLYDYSIDKIEQYDILIKYDQIEDAANQIIRFSTVSGKGKECHNEV